MYLQSVVTSRPSIELDTTLLRSEADDSKAATLELNCVRLVLKVTVLANNVLS